MIKYKNYLYINIENPKKTLNKVKNIFKPLRCTFNFYWRKHSSILYCQKPVYIHIMARDVLWKDKYNTPRFENEPFIWISLFNLNFIWKWTVYPHHYDDEYWEQVLWYLFYYDNISYGCDEPNLEKAKESWPWQDMNGNSTWTDEFLVK